MNQKNKVVAVMVLMVCFMSSSAFADQDYRQRNFFNHVSDWCATMGRNQDERQRIIDQRIDMRAQRRAAGDHKHGQDNRSDKQYNDRMNDLDHKDMQQQIDNNHQH